MRSLKIRMLGVVRYLRPDHNPLRRRLDRVHARLVLLLATLFVVLASVAVAMTASLVDHAGLRAENRQAWSRHKAVATVLGPSPVGSRIGFGQDVRIGWRDSTGTARAGVTAAVAGDRTGTRRAIWVDRTGALTGRPRRHSQTIADTVMAALTVLTSVALAHAAVYSFANRRLDRRRMLLWEREWTTIAPRWTGRS